MAFVYQLEVDSDGNTPGSWSDWAEDYVGGNSGAAEGTFPSSNWNIDLDAPATTSGQNGTDGGGLLIDETWGANGFFQITDDGGTSLDPLDANDGNLDAGEKFTLYMDADGDGNIDTDVNGDPVLYYAEVDYYFTPNANADTSLMVFKVYSDATYTTVDMKYAYNMGDGQSTTDPLAADYDPQKVAGGRITEGMTNNGHTFDSYEDRVIVCFVRGTKIATEHGDVAVEDLELGQLVNTLGNGPQPLRWIGKIMRRAKGNLAPIRIKAGALGDNVPQSDLLVSPAHRMLVSGWRAEVLFGEPEYLVPAKALVNDDTITVARDLEEVEYFHIMFDDHQIVMSDGAPSESFHPTQDAIGSLDSAARAELLSLFPELEDMASGKRRASVRPTLSVAEARLLS